MFLIYFSVNNIAFKLLFCLTKMFAEGFFKNDWRHRLMWQFSINAMTMVTNILYLLELILNLIGMIKK